MSTTIHEHLQRTLLFEIMTELDDARAADVGLPLQDCRKLIGRISRVLQTTAPIKTKLGARQRELQEQNAHRSRV